MSRASPRVAAVAYIPLTALFAPGGGKIFDQLPSGSVVRGRVPGTLILESDALL